MISETAGQAMQIRSGIETCKNAMSSDWRGIIDRIVYDLDAAGDTLGVEVVKGILWESWTVLPDKSSMDASLAGRVRQAGEGS
jgi:hypothetical protein